VQPDHFEALYVQSAGLTNGDDSFALQGLAPSTPMFSDRRERIVDHLTAAQVCGVRRRSRRRARRF